MQILSPSAVTTLRAHLADSRSGISGTREDSAEDQPVAAPEVYFAKIPGGGSPGRSGTTLGSASCELYRAEPTTLGGSTRELQPILYPDGTPAVRNVHNSATAAIPGPDAGGEEYVPIWRTTGGAWFTMRF